MAFWRLLKNRQMGSRKKNQTYHFVLGEPLPSELTHTATQKERNHADSLAVRSSNTPIQDELYQRWILLSPREQDVTALTCLKFTNPQIAAHLGLSKETVKTYLEKVLNKLRLQSKADLRVTFANWDFSAWAQEESRR